MAAEDDEKLTAAERRANLAKARAESRKLIAERRKLVYELRTERRRFGLEVVRSLGAAGAFLTAILAIGSLLWTINSQTEQRRQEREQARDQAFLSLLQQFGESEGSARLSAAAGLELYLRQEYLTYNIRTSHLFIRTVEAEDEGPLRDFLGDALVQNATESTIALLREQNLRLQRRLATIVNVQPRQLIYWEQPFLDWSAPVWLEPGATQRAAAARRHIGVLSWNVKTLIGSLNGIARARPRPDGATVYELTGLDLSRVFLSLPEVSVTPAGGMSADPRYIRHPRPSLHFRDVDLTGAKLSWLRFEDCRFTDTRLDRAVLAGTRFVRCRFDGGTSLGDFVWWLASNHLHYAQPPHWTDSSLEVERLWPDLESDGAFLADTADHRAERREAPYFEFQNTTWQIHQPIPEGVSRRLFLVRATEQKRPDGTVHRRTERTELTSAGSGTWTGALRDETPPAGGR